MNDCVNRILSKMLSVLGPRVFLVILIIGGSKAELVKLRYYVGLSIPEVAQALGLLQRIEQLVALHPGAVDDAAPQVGGLDDVVHLAAHLLLERLHIVGIAGVPNRQRRFATIADGVWVWVVLPQLLPGRLFVVIREVAQEKERQHVVAEVVRVH